jgi:hypothetical protein
MAPTVSWYTIALEQEHQFTVLPRVDWIRRYIYQMKMQTTLNHIAPVFVMQPMMPISSRINVKIMAPGTFKSAVKMASGICRKE